MFVRRGERAGRSSRDLLLVSTLPQTTASPQRRAPTEASPRIASPRRISNHQSLATSHFLTLPSVPVDDLLDDHAVEFEECKRWANSDAGQAARMTNPAGFANVRAHAAAHLRALGVRAGVKPSAANGAG